MSSVGVVEGRLGRLGRLVAASAKGLVLWAVLFRRQSQSVSSVQKREKWRPVVPVTDQVWMPVRSEDQPLEVIVALNSVLCDMARTAGTSNERDRSMAMWGHWEHTVGEALSLWSCAPR